MTASNFAKRIAIIGGGPSGLFLYKRLLESNGPRFTVDIFESTSQLGAGMPYSREGANTEHITNVSGNEIPALVTPIVEWINTLPAETLMKYNLDAGTFHEFMTLPRLLFGEYLNAQFTLLQKKAETAGPLTCIHLNSMVTDIADAPEIRKVIIEIAGKTKLEFDNVIICTGHNWPVTYEGTVPGYFDSPYPPAKLRLHLNHKVAVRGSSLTAIDAIRTLARQNGRFIQQGPHRLSYLPNENAKDFKIVMHSRNGLLPAIRFHLDDSHLSNRSLLSKEEIEAHMKRNNGFLSLDYIFEKDFKDPIKEKDPAFYDHIKHLSMEEFVEEMMSRRESGDPFVFFKGEYAEAEKSIKREKSIFWKEMLGALSFAMNYPAKHLSAEDMLRLRHVLMPLISIVIAYVPQSSSEEMIALHDAGRLELISVGNDSHVDVNPDGDIIYIVTDEDGQKQETRYKTFVDCIGQPHLMLDAFPFKSLINKGTVSPARLKFRSPEAAIALLDKDCKDITGGDKNGYYLKVPGIAITDSFRPIGKNAAHSARIHIMAVPYIGGYNPDYSGLDFCEEASRIIVEDIFNLLNNYQCNNT